MTLTFIFPGQGCHFIGMGKHFFDNRAIYTELFEEASDILGYDLKRLCLDGPVSELNKIDNMLCAIFTANVGIYNVFHSEYGIIPTYMAGHSLGEYSALVCAGAMGFGDSLNIIRQRARIMEAVKGGSMTVVENLPYQITEGICQRLCTESHWAGIACYNSENQCVISGHSQALRHIGDFLVKAGAKLTPLLNSPPAHSPLMRMTEDMLRRLLSSIEIRTPAATVISNTDASPYDGRLSIADKLSRQLSNPVQWIKTIDYIIASGVKHAIEFGPQKTLGMFRSDSGKVLKIYAYSQKQDRELIGGLLNE